MPIDIELKKKAAEQELQALLSGQAGSLPSDIESITSKVRGTRDFSVGSDFISGLGIKAPMDTTTQTNALNRELQKRMASARFGRSRNILNNRMSALNAFQDNATNLRQGREANARNVRSELSSEQFQSGQNALTRETNKQLQGISDSAATRGIDLRAQYANYQPGNPLVRMLATLGGTIGTSLLLKGALNRGGGGTTPTIPNQAGIGGYSPYDRYTDYGNAVVSGGGGRTAGVDY